ncbi:DUF6248 family natural product biosynthesis protein [Streptomyces sp. NPDC058434]|uniref:DUF6248 family natural product biosynthesis protein n=1 Tax=Streptomyces sp. NPDC058434 TaxID=3346498 RepID=UPI0036626E99
MTTRLRHIGASIMGILDPVPSTVPSPMAEEEGTWVRAHAWTKGLRRIEDAYPHGFHRWCSCERRSCQPCAGGRHDQCANLKGPRVDQDAGTITDQRGFVVAVIRHGPDQRPCRWVCPCTHHANVEPAGDVDAAETSSSAPRARPSQSHASLPAGQLSLFTGCRLPTESVNGEAP